MDHRLVCQACGTEYDPRVDLWVCPTCDPSESGWLDVQGELTGLDSTSLPFGDDGETRDMWRYRDLLPVLTDEPISLGEGWTPLTRLDRISSWAGVSVRLKNETVNPTWSFKDRLNALVVSNARAKGYTRIAVSTTGNHGASTAAYARRGGLNDVIVLLHPESQRPARIQVRASGAAAVVTDANGRGELLAQLVEQGWYPTTRTPSMMTGLPYGYEAYKTIAYELVEQTDSLPDAVFVPTGLGDGFYGIWKGFRELHELGMIDEPPRMIAVQPAEQAPLVAAVQTGTTDVSIPADSPPITISSATANVAPHAYRAIVESDGFAVPVERETLEEAIRKTGADGVFLEPASALATAGPRCAVQAGHLDGDEEVVAIGTGSGVKWPAHAEPIVGSVPTIEPTVDALAEATGMDLG